MSEAGGGDGKKGGGSSPGGGKLMGSVRKRGKLFKGKKGGTTGAGGGAVGGRNAEGLALLGLESLDEGLEGLTPINYPLVPPERDPATAAGMPLGVRVAALSVSASDHERYMSDVLRAAEVVHGAQKQAAEGARSLQRALQAYADRTKAQHGLVPSASTLTEASVLERLPTDGAVARIFDADDAKLDVGGTNDADARLHAVARANQAVPAALGEAAQLQGQMAELLEGQASAFETDVLAELKAITGKELAHSRELQARFARVRGRLDAALTAVAEVEAMDPAKKKRAAKLAAAEEERDAARMQYQLVGDRAVNSLDLTNKAADVVVLRTARGLAQHQHGVLLASGELAATNAESLALVGDSLPRSTEDSGGAELETWDDAEALLVKQRDAKRSRARAAARKAQQSGVRVAVFGTPLRDLCQRESREMPAIVEALAAYLREHASLVEGVFRVNASITLLADAKKDIDQGLGGADETRTFVFETLRQRIPGGTAGGGGDLHVHFCAHMLKIFLRDLPDPLLTEKYHDELLASVRVGGDTDAARLRPLAKVLGHLPRENRRVLMAVLQVCRVLIDHCDVTRMNPKNLATVLTPNILTTRKQSAVTPEVMMQQMEDASLVVTRIIQGFMAEDAFLLRVLTPGSGARDSTAGGSRSGTPDKHRSGTQRGDKRHHSSSRRRSTSKPPLATAAAAAAAAAGATSSSSAGATDQSESSAAAAASAGSAADSGSGAGASDVADDDDDDVDAYCTSSDDDGDDDDADDGGRDGVDSDDSDSLPATPDPTGGAAAAAAASSSSASAPGGAAGGRAGSSAAASSPSSASAAAAAEGSGAPAATTPISDVYESMHELVAAVGVVVQRVTDDARNLQIAELAPSVRDLALATRAHVAATSLLPSAALRAAAQVVQESLAGVIGALKEAAAAQDDAEQASGGDAEVGVPPAALARLRESVVELVRAVSDVGVRVSLLRRLGGLDTVHRVTQVVVNHTASLLRYLTLGLEAVDDPSGAEAREECDAMLADFRTDLDGELRPAIRQVLWFLPPSSGAYRRFATCSAAIDSAASAWEDVARQASREGGDLESRRGLLAPAARDIVGSFRELSAAVDDARASPGPLATAEGAVALLAAAHKELSQAQHLLEGSDHIPTAVVIGKMLANIGESSGTSAAGALPTGTANTFAVDATHALETLLRTIEDGDEAAVRGLTDAQLGMLEESLRGAVDSLALRAHQERAGIAVLPITAADVFAAAVPPSEVSVLSVASLLRVFAEAVGKN